MSNKFRLKNMLILPLFRVPLAPPTLSIPPPFAHSIFRVQRRQLSFANMVVVAAMSPGWHCCWCWRCAVCWAAATGWASAKDCSQFHYWCFWRVEIGIGMRKFVVAVGPALLAYYSLAVERPMERQIVMPLEGESPVRLRQNAALVALKFG